MDVSELPTCVDALKQGSRLAALRVVRCELNLLDSARIVVDPNHMAQVAAARSADGAVVGNILQVVKACDPRSRRFRKPDSDLRVVHAGAGSQGGDGNLSVGNIQMKRAAVPSLLEALRRISRSAQLHTVDDSSSIASGHRPAACRSIRVRRRRGTPAFCALTGAFWTVFAAASPSRGGGQWRC